MNNLCQIHFTTLTDAQWNRIKFVFEEPPKVGRPTLFAKCLIITEKSSNRFIARRKKHQSPCPYQRENETFECGIDGRGRDSVHDSESDVALFKGIKLTGKTILADKAYSCKRIRVFFAEHGAVACIPDKSNFRIKPAFDSELYKHRNIVERFFQRIKNYRHIATRYDKLAECFLNLLLLAASVIHF